MKQRILNIVLGTASLLLGLFLYMIFRQDTHISKLFDSCKTVLLLRSLMKSASNSFSKFYLPDFLWCFSLTCGFIAIFIPNRKNLFLCALFAFFAGVTWEIAQLFHIVSGTFDFIDILMYMAASFLVVIINSFQKEKKQ